MKIYFFNKNLFFLSDIDHAWNHFLYMVYVTLKILFFQKIVFFNKKLFFFIKIIFLIEIIFFNKYYFF